MKHASTSTQVTPRQTTGLKRSIYLAPQPKLLGDLLHTNMAPLWQLCRDGKLAEVREALARGEDVNSKADEDEEGFLTALMGAMFSGDTEIVKLLLEQPTVDLNCSDTSGPNALHKAAFFDF